MSLSRRDETLRKTGGEMSQPSAAKPNVGGVGR
jgi:hypothetical protein